MPFAEAVRLLVDRSKIQQQGDMPRSPSQHCDELELIYVLRKHGWSDLYLIVSGEIHEFVITHIMSDPIEDLIGLCSSIIDRSDCWIRLYGEPGATLVKVTSNRDQKHLVDLSIFGSDNWERSPEAADLQISVTTKAVLLIDQIVYQLYKIQALSNEKSYARDRSEFPQQAFKELIAKWEAEPNPSKSASSG